MSATEEKDSSKTGVDVEQVAEMTGPTSVHGLHRKRFGKLAILGLAFAILNSPTAASASLSIVIVSGGPAAAVWGMLISAIGVLCIAASMAEICECLRQTLLYARVDAPAHPVLLASQAQCFPPREGRTTLPTAWRPPAFATGLHTRRDGSHVLAGCASRPRRRVWPVR